MAATLLAERRLTPAESPSIFAAKLLGIELHPGQIEWLECRARVKVACCGRRWGKSYAEAVDLLWMACAYPGSQQYLIAPTYDQVTTIFDYAVAMIHGAHPTIRQTLERVVRSPFPEIAINGSTIHARSAGESGANIRSKGADRVLFDESAFIPDVARSAIAPLLANSEMAWEVNISTPFGKDRFFELFQRGTRGDDGYASFQFPSSSSPYVQQEYLEAQRHDLTALEFGREYEAQFIDDQNAVFPWPLIERCLEGELAEPLPGHRYVLGYDPAKYVDRSAVVVVDITAQPHRVVAILDIAGRDYLIQLDQVEAIARRYNRASILVDSTHNDPLLEELQARGLAVEGYQFTNPSKQQLINGLVLAMEQDRLRFPNHRDLVTEMTYYRYELTSAGNVKLGADSRHHDDLVTALALAVRHAGDAEGLPYAYLRNDPSFRAAVAPETTDERIARRRAASGI